MPDDTPASFVERNQVEPYAELRRLAEARLQREGAQLDTEAAHQDALKLLHELQTHRVELQLQNEQLRYSQLELARSRDQYSDLYDRAPVGYLTMDGTGIICQANRKMATMLGRRRRELLNSPMVASVAPTDQELFFRHLRALTSARQACRCELRLSRADRTVFWAEIESTTLEDPETGSVELRAAVSDISQRKQVELELRKAKLAADEANLAKSAFLSNMSHEMRSPLAVVIALADAMVAQRSVGRECMQHLQTIQHSAEHLLTLIDDILDLSKIEVGQKEPQWEEFSLRDLLNEVERLMEVKATEKGLALYVDADANLPSRVRSDRRWLKQILINLMTNAIKFTEEGKIQLCVSLPEKGILQFEVSDTGVGIESSDLEKIFEDFVQADSSDTRSYGGSGLGLSISQRLAKQIDGRIDARSEPDVGSVFTLTLKSRAVAPDQAHASQDSKRALTPSEHHSSARAPARVLLVDDSPVIRQSVGLLFATLNARLETAENGEQAQEKAQRSQDEGIPYDLILMDIQMPHVDGYETTARLRQAGWTGPIVALTARAMPEDQQKCFSVGCNGFLAKPFRLADLVALLDKHAVVKR